MNVSNLELILVQKISNSTSTLDTLIYSKALQELKTGTVTVVNTTADLPNPNTAFVGHLFYEKTTEAMYLVDTLGFARKITTETNNINVWGGNAYGQLGDGTTTNRSSPGTVAGSGNNWWKITAGCNFSLAIKTDGTLWTWGRNNSGQLGDGTLTSRCSPGTVAGGGTNWLQVGIGDNFGAAIKTDGTLWTWGTNGAGQLGDGTATSRCSPGAIAGGGGNWCFIGSGLTALHLAAIKTDGTLWTWGRNNFGQLGDGTVTNRSQPVQVAGGGTTWCAVSRGAQHTVAIKTDGTLWTWGYNVQGQLGDGTTTSRSSPGTVAGGGSTWCNISSGINNVSAIKTDGTLWTWGQNGSGRLGDGSTTNRSSPGTVAGGGTTWCAVSAGSDHSSAFKTDGTLWTWGANGCGKLGDGTVTARSSPGTVIGNTTNWINVANGSDHTIAICATRGG